jgi:hypothetical protein
MDGQTQKSKPSYECKFCGKKYARESTLTAHLCEPKRRSQQENETGVRLGYQSYLRFYEITQGSAKHKTYMEFAKSQFYLAFVKFGRYQTEIRCVNPAAFTDWLLKNNKALDHWCKDSFYTDWLRDYLKKEAPQDALERALKEMTSYAEINPELQNNFHDYFRLGNDNRILHHISTGRISPWVLFNCQSGVEYLERLNEGQVTLLMPWIDPDYWTRKFRDYTADAEWCKMILKQAGL